MAIAKGCFLLRTKWLQLRTVRMNSKTHYESLGVGRNASPAEIKEAFYSLCKKVLLAIVFIGIFVKDLFKSISIE